MDSRRSFADSAVASTPARQWNRNSAPCVMGHVAADRNDRRAWAEHKARLELGIIPFVPAPVVAKVSRSPQQAQLRRFLTGCAVVPLSEREAHEAGWLLGKTRTADVVDAVVVTTALRKDATILTSDPDDIGRLVRASGCDVPVVAV